MTIPGGFAASTRYLLYLPRLLVVAPESLRTDRVAQLDGSVVFADVSGFTALSEELAKGGKVGSEQITEIINGVFTELLAVSRLEGGDLISFGGDALLLLFIGPDHPRRAAAAAHEMRAALAEYQSRESTVELSMSVGVASGEIIAVAAGSELRQLLLVGSTVDEAVELEAAAEAGEILLSESTAAAIEPEVLGDARQVGRLLIGAPEPSDVDPQLDDNGGEPQDLAPFIPPALRHELLLSGAQGEHRPAVIAFVRAQGIGSRLAEGGPAAASDALDVLVDTAVSAASDHGVILLASDVSADGVNLILAAGVPQAIPEAEERMLRTVRRIADATMPMTVHVGIAAGDVFAGNLGAAFRRGYTVMGDTVNLAARLAGWAEPGQVLTTWRVLDGSRTRFESRELAAVSLKGKTAPIKPIELGAMIISEDANGATGHQLIDRSDELGALLEATEELVRGRGSVIEMLGPPGIGKTRLLHELRARVAHLRTMIIECEEYEAATSYYAAGLLLRHLTDLKAVRSAGEVGARLTELIESRLPRLAPWLPLLAIPYEAHVEETPEVRSLDPSFRLPRLFEVIGELLEHLMPDPTAVGFDNAHWMDPASRELFSAVMLRHAHRPWLWVWAHRAEQPQLDEALGTTTMQIDPLPEDEARQLVFQVAPERSPITVEEIVERGAGNPLFLTELASAPADAGVSDTVERLVAARIDRLSARERRVLREAAVLGQQFDLDLLAEVLGSESSAIDDPEVWARLDEFLELGAAGRIGFRQPLVRDVAYEGLPFRRRQDLHGLVADIIERRARHRAHREAAVLSLHFEAAEHFQKAWEYAVVGAQRATERYANREAVTLFERALRTADRLPALDDEEKATVAEELGDVAELAGDFERAWSAYEAAERVGSGARTAELTRKKALLREKAGDYDEAVGLLESALEVSATTDQARAEVMVAMAGIRYRQGRYKESADWCEQALATVVDVDSATSAHARYLLSLNQTHLDHPQRLDNARAALAVYERLEDWAGVGKVLNNLGIEAYYGGRWSEAADLYARSREASAKAGDVVMTATLDNNLAEILSDQGALEEADKLFRRAETIWRSAHYEIGVALVKSNRGRLALRRADTETARTLLAEALDRFEKMGAEAFVAETRIRLIETDLLERNSAEALKGIEAMLEELGDREGAAPLLVAFTRLQGHALSQCGQTSEAKDALRSAQSRATEIGALYEAGLAARSLGRLGDEQAATYGERVLSTLGAGEAPDLPLT